MAADDPDPENYHTAPVTESDEIGTLPMEPQHQTGSDATPTVGFVGVGTMGAPMVRQLLAAGLSVVVHDPSPEAMAAVTAGGASPADSPALVASACDQVLLSLPTPATVEQVVVGPDGVLAANPLPGTVVDLSTNAPDTVRSLAAECERVGVAFVDAPVSGGPRAAANGTLTVMVGADAAAFADVEPTLRCIGSNVLHVGAVGTGTVAKIVNNQLFLGAGVLVQECYVLAAALGMNPSDVHQVIAASSAGPYAKLAPLLLGRRFDDVIFRMDIAAKDLGLAVDEATSHDAAVPMTAAALDVYRAALDAGDGELVFHATLRELERRAGISLDPLERRPPGEQR